MKSGTLIWRFARIAPVSIYWGMLIVWGLLATIPAEAQTYTDLHDFNAGAGEPYNSM